MEKHPNIHLPEKGFGDIYIIKCVDFLDATNKGALEAAVDFCIAQNNPKIVFDFSKLDYMASAGANVIIGTLQKLREAGGDLLLLKPQEHVTEIINVLGLDEEVNIALDEGAAMRFFRDLKDMAEETGLDRPEENGR